MSDEKILIGKIVGAHGIKGIVKIFSYSDPEEDIFNMNLFNNKEERIKLKKLNKNKNIYLAKLENVSNRSEAEKYNHTKLYIHRSCLPHLGDNKFYICDMIGLEVLSEQNKKIGIVKDIQNYGAGDIIEIELSKGGTIIHQFTIQNFPEIGPDYIIIKNKLI